MSSRHNRNQRSVRRAIKAGSWYEGDPKELDLQLTRWLESAGPPVFGPAKAIISPHAGYTYCGSTAAHAYKEISPDTKRIFILGPSHHVRLNGIALSPAKEYETPFCDLRIDQEIYQELQETGHFETMSLTTDEQEHSLELQLPYIAKVMNNRVDEFTIIPMMVGSLNKEKESFFGRILSRYLADPQSCFVISSDFCHWGQRFEYQHYDQSWGAIYESIEKLDKLGMKAIKDLTVNSFNSYLKHYGNTICGRRPIGVLLGAIEHLNSQSDSNQAMSKYLIKFLNYSQSSKCRNMYDSSVSYAAASVKEFGGKERVRHLDDIVDV